MYFNNSVDRVALFSERRLKEKKEEISMFQFNTYIAHELRVTEQYVLYYAKSRPLSDCSPRHVLGGASDAC